MEKEDFRAEINQEEAKKYDLSLGQKIGMSSKYDPGILRAVPRSDNRSEMFTGIIPFKGFDVWNCYEVTFLTQGRPQMTKLKIVYSAESPSIVESKSLKLYLGSFAMEEMTHTSLIETVEKDLSALLETSVEVSFVSESRQWVTEELGQYGVCLDKIAVDRNWQCSEYKRNPLLLEQAKGAVYGRHWWYFNALRSNCRVTHQPDYGTLFIWYTGMQVPTEESLYKYLVSFRGENHFHEEIVEQIFVDLNEQFNPAGLAVCAMYTRRGGIDINPVRWKGISDAFEMPFGFLARKGVMYSTNKQ